jgi:gamma-glutamyltranspeptidase
VLHSPLARRGMVTAPHHLASEAGIRVLREGGNAVEAMVAMAAAIAVVYPHMTAIGGDGFWLIAPPGGDPVAIDACGRSGAAVGADLYRGRAAIPARGPLAANTVAGTVSGWGAALEVARTLGGRLPLERLLEDAVHHAEAGVPATGSQSRFAADKMAELKDVSGFAAVHLPDGRPPAPGQTVHQPALGATLRRIAADGPDGFYRGALARTIAADLARAGSPVTADDLARHRAERVEPLGVDLSVGRVWNLPPPTQGLASLIILGVFDRLGVAEADGFPHVHGLVEATKRAFRIRDRHVTCPSRLKVDPRDFLTEEALGGMAADIDMHVAMAWPPAGGHSDTVWMGAIDGDGCAVSFIQSIYWEFGSGVVLRDSGILWQNRGASFQLDPAAVNAVGPGLKPFHTLNPALARLADGRTMAYGTMGGEGQPQTQATVFTRHVLFGQGLQAAVTAPRWLLGRTWGAQSTTLKLEDRFDAGLIGALKAAGHVVETVPAFSDLMGHAGAIVRRPDGTLEGAADPRSNGAVGAW